MTQVDAHNSTYPNVLLCIFSCVITFYIWPTLQKASSILKYLVAELERCSPCEALKC